MNPTWQAVGQTLTLYDPFTRAQGRRPVSRWHDGAIIGIYIPNVKPFRVWFLAVTADSLAFELMSVFPDFGRVDWLRHAENARCSNNILERSPL
jgi:hypothetical protein